MLRIIYSLRFDLDGHTSLVVPIDRRGQAAPRRAKDAKNCMPKPPKRRTIDLRPGDEVFARNCWRRILAVEVARDDWLTVDEAKGLSGTRGEYLSAGEYPLAAWSI